MADPRTLASVWAAKGTALASRALRRGGGTAASGLVGLWLQPGLIGDLASQLGEGCIVITGTNGKTTTSSLIAGAAKAAGFDVLANASGSNLVRGIASTLTLAAGSAGRIAEPEHRIGVLEVDEATIPLVLPQLKPRVAVFTNLFRDQLDRYGEVDAVASRWRDALAQAPSDLRLVLNADDPSVASLGEGRDGVVYFGVEGKKLDRGAPEHASDALSCRCGARLEYSVVYYGHAGHWRCPVCGRKRPKTDVAARRVDLGDGRRLRFQLGIGDDRTQIEMALGGLYNVYNALAAAAAGVALSLPSAAIVEALTGASAAFGRQEAFEIDGRRVELYLGKNPAGLNQVLSTILLDESRRSALFVLNDGIADGRDISWVWDADFEVAAGKLDRVVVSGTRAEDMALRLKYAEWPEQTLEVDPDLARALDRAIAITPPGECLTVVPTYTAMLSLRELLARRTGRAAFWQS
ncbi:MAG TPA: MurT ligase domain-containing protein [Candidatus Limnocylindria bacterium]|nr:MurT ligase domain-containing protein [Candidatus Limnocylindria bacterium]